MSIIATIERHPRPAHTHQSNGRIPQDYGNSACLFMWEFGDADYHNYDHHYRHDDYYRPSAIVSDDSHKDLTPGMFRMLLSWSFVQGK